MGQIWQIGLSLGTDRLEGQRYCNDDLHMLLRGVERGWLNKSYREPAIKAFNAIANTKASRQCTEMFAKAGKQYQ